MPISRSKEPLTYEEAMHELRKAHKGMRRLQRRLMITEGILACIHKETRRYNLSETVRLSYIEGIAQGGFHDASHVDKAFKKFMVYVANKVLS